jgi:hypothetical protein
MRSIRLVCLVYCLAMVVPVFAQAPAADALSGTWIGDWGPSPEDRNQVTVELKWDGKNLTGTVNPGPNAVELQKATFDPKKGVIHFEADAKNRRGNTIHYVVDGKVEKSSMTGTWSHDNRKGDFKITKK